jgi:putative spermidine/putrescine transport system substrate-binding protein
MNRREILIGSATAVGAMALSPLDSASAQKSQEVIFNGAGGSWQDNVRKAWLAPFTASTGVKVTDTFPFDLGKMETMVKINSVTWDITDCPSAFLAVALDRNLVEPLDYSVIDRTLLSPENYGDRYVAYSEFSANIVYDKRRIPGPDAPSSWKDYWDLKKFPGPRSFRKNPLMALEAALLADGVAADKLYPLDLDRAFKKLDEIKKDVRWWTDAQQSVQLIANGEVIMGMTFASRAIAARAQGVPLEVVWDQALRAKTRFVVPKGAPNKENAMKLLNFIIQAEQQARFAMMNKSAPTNAKAFASIDEAVARDLITFPANRDKAIVLDELGYWRTNGEAVAKRYDRWLIA